MFFFKRKIFLHFNFNEEPQECVASTHVRCGLFDRSMNKRKRRRFIKRVRPIKSEGRISRGCPPAGRLSVKTAESEGLLSVVYVINGWHHNFISAKKHTGKSVPRWRSESNILWSVAPHSCCGAWNDVTSQGKPENEFKSLCVSLCVRLHTATRALRHLVHLHIFICLPHGRPNCLRFWEKIMLMEYWNVIISNNTLNSHNSV